MTFPGATLISLLLFSGATLDTKETHVARGRVFLDVKAFDRAAQQFEAAARLDPRDVDVQFLLGLSLFADNRLEESIAPFERVCDALPRDALAPQCLGRVLFRLERFDQACLVLAHAIEIDDGDARTFNHMGASLLRLGRAKESLVHFERAVELSPDYSVARYNYGAVLAAAGRTEEAIEQLEEAARLDPGDVDPREALADLHLERGDTERARDWYVEAAEREPGRSRYWRSAAEASLRLGEFPEAELQLRAACEAPDASADSHWLLSGLMRQLGRLESAARQMDRALALEPGWRPGLLAAADLAEDLGDAVRAREHLRRAHELGEPDPHVLRRLSALSERLGDSLAAVSAFNELRETSDPSQETMLAIAHRMISSELPGIRNPPQARSLAVALVARSGGRRVAPLLVLARAEEAMGEPAAAARALERAADLLPSQDATSMDRSPRVEEKRDDD